MPRDRWSFLPNDQALCLDLGQQLKVGPLLVQCLLNRGLHTLSELQSFLSPRLQDLADPYLLPDMLPAVQRLILARDSQELVVIFGDYDADGVTSAALLWELLGELGWQVQVYLPNRFQEGYGLTPVAIKNCLLKFPARVLLAVDCGSNAVEPIHELQAAGIDVIVLDHHQLSDPAPKPCALVNPHRASDRHGAVGALASVGLAFKMAHALVKFGRSHHEPRALQCDIRPWLDLVALGSIADLVPLWGENRILVRAGLERLNQSQRPGLCALKSVARLEGPIGVHQVSFQLAPRLNAAGRLEDASAALNLLLSRDAATAERLAAQLETHNLERRQMEQNIFEQVSLTLQKTFQPDRDLVIVAEDVSWHTGVIGIVASRVLREFYRPTLLVGGEGRGSGRSIEGFDLAAALRGCDDLLLKHGGHAMAAGFTIKPGMIDRLRTRINEVAQCSLSRETLSRTVHIDAQVDLSTGSFQQIAELEKLEPVGQGNPPARLALCGINQACPARRFGKDEQHAKFWITKEAVTREVIWWNCGKTEIPDGPFDLVVAPSMRTYNGVRQMQLQGLCCRPAAS